ncbi:MAG: DUF928 domain-containing protein [Oscillatoria sp. SIO1A7]|nr:DUF928 domain-containing protein [Oscillatoria sp. SIO1A7]
MNKRNLAFIFALALLSATSYPTLSEARPDRLVNASSESKQFKPPPPPPGGRPRGRRFGAASRPADSSAQCPEVAVNLAALVPEIGVIGNTVKERPTFWFYFPYESKDVHSARFVLLDEKEEYVQEPIEVSLPEKPGVIGIRLPSDSRSLEVGKTYDWRLTVFCDSEDMTVRDSVYGSVQRVAIEPSLLDALEQSESQHVAYAENGIWYEAIGNLAERLYADPTNADLIAAWERLLGDVKLEQIANVRYIEYSVPTQRSQALGISR